LIVFLIKCNANLNNEVKRRTKELELANEQLKVHDKMQREFINVAAPELRTPVQPILGLSEVLQSRENDEEKLTSRCNIKKCKKTTKSYRRYSRRNKNRKSILKAKKRRV
jgi:signal transduction histidine kinase